jgi:hypothetical protein
MWSHGRGQFKADQLGLRKVAGFVAHGDHVHLVLAKCITGRHRVESTGEERCIIPSGHSPKGYDPYAITLLYIGQLRFAGVAQW